MKALVDKAGGAVTVAGRARVGYATVYRAMQGQRPGRVQVYALALALGTTEAAIEAAIDRSKGAA